MTVSLMSTRLVQGKLFLGSVAELEEMVTPMLMINVYKPSEGTCTLDQLPSASLNRTGSLPDLVEQAK